MFAVAYLIHFPEEEDPRMESIQLYPSFDEAEKRTKELIDEFISDYGEDMIEYATKESPVAVMYNGDVDCIRLYKRSEQIILTNHSESAAMQSFHEIIQNIRVTSTNAKQAGTRFEVLILRCFLATPLYNVKQRIGGIYENYA